LIHSLRASRDPSTSASAPSRAARRRVARRFGASAIVERGAGACGESTRAATTTCVVTARGSGVAIANANVREVSAMVESCVVIRHWRVRFFL